MICPTTCQNGGDGHKTRDFCSQSNPPQGSHRPSGGGRKLRCALACCFVCTMAFILLIVFGTTFLRPLNDWMSPKTFWRKDHDTVVKYHIRDYRVPWSEQLLAAIAFARKHGGQLYLEDTPSTVFARNRGNVKTVNIPESEQAALRRISGFLAEYCEPNTQRTFPTAIIAAEAKHLLDDVLLEHPQLFYAHYLLGVWYREYGDDSTMASFDKAFDVADCVIVCPVMMLDERSGKVVPIAETRFPCGVTTTHRTGQWGDFTLWYPAVETDQHGLVRLPVYREMIRDPAFEAVDADGTRKIVETFGLRDIAKPYRFGLYMPIVLSGELYSRLTCTPGFEEELRYTKRRVFTNLPLDDVAALSELGMAFEKPDRLLAVEGSIIMPTIRYANEFGDLHFRGLTRTELTRQLRLYRNINDRKVSSLVITDGDNFIVSRNNGRTYLCRFLASNDPQQPGVLDVWDLSWCR